jgi:hypothetical protein
MSKGKKKFMASSMVGLFTDFINHPQGDFWTALASVLRSANRKF